MTGPFRFLYIFCDKIRENNMRSYEEVRTYEDSYY